MSDTYSDLRTFVVIDRHNEIRAQELTEEDQPILKLNLIIESQR